MGWNPLEAGRNSVDEGWGPLEASGCRMGRDPLEAGVG